MDRLNLEGKVAIVTGSSSGIGEAIATLFVRRGAKVVLHGRDEKKLNKVKETLDQLILHSRDRVATVRGDITDESVRKDLVDTAISTFGRLDILVNNAGSFCQEFIRDAQSSHLDQMHALFLKAPVALAQLALPHLGKSRGNIVNISACGTVEVVQKMFTTTSAIAAQDSFTQYAAVEFGHAGIRVNSVRPGIIVTPTFDFFPPEQRKQLLKSLSDTAVLSRNGKPDDIAQAVGYLASDAASFVTGTFINVDGGRVLYRDRGQKGEEPKYDDLIGQE